MYQNILRLEGIMVLLVLCGVALRRRKLITDEGQDCLTDLMTTLILPCNIFLSFPQQMDLAMLRSFFLTILISVLVMAASALRSTGGGKSTRARCSSTGSSIPTPCSSACL